MSIHAPIVLRAAEEEDWQHIRGLVSVASRVHSHLDWHDPKAWLGIPSFVVLRSGSRLLALLAMVPEVDGVAWLRMAAVENGLDVRWQIDRLYHVSRFELMKLGITRLAVLSSDPWLEPVLVDWGFAASELVLVLIRARGGALPCAVTVPEIRKSNPEDDLAAIVGIDNAAFALPWSYSKEMLALALRQASYSTVAEVDDQVVGYQISTGGGQNAHMARLAVHPGSQKQGIGRALASDVIRYFESVSALAISVNTQEYNYASMQLYRSLGFEGSGDSHMVWQMWLH